MEIGSTGRPRRPWVAFVLSLFAPGLGHVYNGDVTDGVIRYVVVMGAGSAALAAWAYLVPSVMVLAVVMAGFFAAFFGVAWTAQRQCRQLPANTPRAWHSRWYGLVGIMLMVTLVAEPIRSAATKYFVQAYRIPAASMLPTLATGDHVFVTKLCYSAKVPISDRVLVTFHRPERGDIVVLRYPEDESKDFIKRVVGIPGDVVEIRDKDLYVNGVLADTSMIQHLDPMTHMDRRDNFGPITVPDGGYFVMGDNRDQSLDSRFWGVVQENKIRGKAVLIYWSWDPAERHARWDRIGRRL